MHKQKWSLRSLHLHLGINTVRKVWDWTYYSHRLSVWTCTPSQFKFFIFHAVSIKILPMGVLDSAMFLCRHNQVHISHYVIIMCSGPSGLCDFSPR